MERQTRSLLLLVVVFLLAAGIASAQSTGSINGAVIDSTQAVVPGAQITLTNTATNKIRRSVSSPEGYFSFPDLEAGQYSLQVTASGFRELVLERLVLTVGQNMTVHPALQVGDVKQTVVVTGEPLLVTTANSSISRLVDTRLLEQLPLNGRNALQFVTLVPGAFASGTGGQFGATQSVFSISGGQTMDTNFSLDGGINVNPFYGIANEYPNPDTLEEFSVDTRAYSAASGRGTSSVTAVTKSGANRFHGTLFEFVRNNVLDARPFFGPQITIFKRNQYGGTLGGPIVKDKLFFFVGYQGTDVRGSPGIDTYPTVPVQERSGDFSALSKPIKNPATGQPFPGNQIPAASIQPSATAFFQNYLPAPNAGTNYVFPLPSTVNQNELTTRVDYYLSNSDRIWTRYLLNNVPSVGVASPLSSAWSDRFPTRFQNITIGYSHIFSPNLVNDFRATYDRIAFGVFPNLNFTFSDIGISNLVPANEEAGLAGESSLQLSGLFTAYPGPPTRNVMGITELNEILTWVRGKHQFSFGGQVYRNRIYNVANHLTRGDLIFSGSTTGNAAADFELGQFFFFQQNSGYTSLLRQVLPSLFVQDDMHLTRRLTFNLGLRWDPDFGYTSDYNKLLTFKPGAQSTVFPKAPTGLLYPGDQGLRRDIVGHRLDNFAPRVGFAWDPRGNGKTSVRGGFGIFYMYDSEGTNYNTFSNLQPWGLIAETTNGNENSVYANPPYNGVSPFPLPSSTNIQALRQLPFTPQANESVLNLPYATESDKQWSLSVQRAVGKDAVLEVAYVGSATSHIFGVNEGNPAPYIPGKSTAANIQQRRLYPQIGSIISLFSGISHNYNALQVSCRRRYAHGLTIISTYAWAHSLGVPGGANGVLPRDPFNVGLDYGPTLDLRHNFTTSLVWDTPWGRSLPLLARALLGNWEMSGIFNARTGFPLTLRSGRDNSLVGPANGIGNETPDQISNWQLPGGRSKAQQIAEWFNTAAFTQNAPGTFGNVGIGAIPGPGFWNADIAIAKSFPIGERRRLEFRGSFYNAFNHANLNAPVSTLTSPAFARIINSSNPRVIEGSLKFTF